MGILVQQNQKPHTFTKPECKSASSRNLKIKDTPIWTFHRGPLRCFAASRSPWQPPRGPCAPSRPCHPRSNLMVLREREMGNDPRKSPSNCWLLHSRASSTNTFVHFNQHPLFIQSFNQHPDSSNKIIYATHRTITRTREKRGGGGEKEEKHLPWRPRGSSTAHGSAQATQHALHAAVDPREAFEGASLAPARHPPQHVALLRTAADAAALRRKIWPWWSDMGQPPKWAALANGTLVHGTVVNGTLVNGSLENGTRVNGTPDMARNSKSRNHLMNPDKFEPWPMTRRGSWPSWRQK